MIDVSRLPAGARCQRCLGRRVVAVSVPTDEWQCADNARPGPYTKDQLRMHSAAVPTDSLDDALEVARRAQLNPQVSNQWLIDNRLK